MVGKILGISSQRFRPGLVEDIHNIMSASPVEGIKGALLGMAQRPNSTPDLQRITCPTLLITADPEQSSRRRLQNFLEKLSDQARLPSTTEFHVFNGVSFREALVAAPRGDINIFGLSLINDRDLPLGFIREVSEIAKSSCVFVIDSGRESALV